MQHPPPPDHLQESLREFPSYLNMILIVKIYLVDHHICEFLCEFMGCRALLDPVIVIMDFDILPLIQGCNLILYGYGLLVAGFDLIIHELLPVFIAPCPSGAQTLSRFIISVPLKLLLRPYHIQIWPHLLP